MRATVPLTIGGMWASGDASAIPDGYCRLVRNMLPRPGPRLDARPPFIYDGLLNEQGLFTWDDLVNQITRFGAIEGTPTVNLRLKSTSDETWGAAISASGTRMTDFANFLGKVYIMFDDGAGNPTTALSFDGTNVSTTPYTSTVVARAVTTYKERQFLSYPRVTTIPVNTIAQCYGSGFASNSSTLLMLTLTHGDTTIVRVYQQDITLSPSYTLPQVAPGAGTADTVFVVRQDFRNNDTINDTPLTVTINVTPATGSPLENLSAAPARNLVVTAGQVGAAFNKLFRATVSGTTAGAAPPFGSTVPLGSTVADGGVTWVAEAKVATTREFVIPNSTTTSNTFTAYSMEFTIPANTNGLVYQPLFAFATNSIPFPPSLANIDIGLKDGLADGDVRKQNYGHQVTKGTYYYPFVNTETATSSTKNIEAVIWTEIQSNVIRGANNQKLNDVPGQPTASTMIGGRLLVFKRRAFWQFSITSDPDIPLSIEDINRRIGCISPRGVDVIDDEAFFIGEDEIYRYRTGGTPIPICGNAMREEIMSKSSTTWVESQSTYKMPILAIDQKNREVWVYTQKGTLYCYHIDNKWWSKHDVSGNPEVRAMLYNPQTQEMYVSFWSGVGGGLDIGLARLDPSLIQNDTIDSTGTTHAITCEVAFKPVENYAPRVDFTAEHLGIFHGATAAQSTDVVTAYWSTDRGVTYPGSYPSTLNITIPRNQFPVWRRGPSVMFKITKTGRAGAAAWSLSKADAMINIHRGEWPTALPTPSGPPNFS